MRKHVCRHLAFDKRGLVPLSFWLLIGKDKISLLLSPMWASLSELVQLGTWRPIARESLATGQCGQLRGSHGKWAGVVRGCTDTGVTNKRVYYVVYVHVCACVNSDVLGVGHKWTLFIFWDFQISALKYLTVIIKGRNQHTLACKENTLLFSTTMDSRFFSLKLHV